MQYLLLSGSFHKRSISLGVMKELTELLSEHQCILPNLQELPFYNEDIGGDKSPSVVVEFLNAVKSSDGIIVCTPEYNHSVPAVLKNAIDWGSRPAFNSPLRDKPVSIITQAVSEVGGARAQAHLKLIFDSTLSKIQPIHEMMITAVNTRFDDQQRLIDEKARVQLKRHVENFIAFSQ